MRYNTLSDHDDVFEIPELMRGDRPMWVGMTSLGEEYEPDDGSRERWAYSVATGPYDADVQYQGEDIRGPAIGPGPSAVEMAATLLGFLSAYAEGDLIDSRDDGGELYLEFDGEVAAVGETAEFIVENGERFGIMSHDLEEDYMAYTDTYWNDDLALWVKRAVQTGKEVE